MFDEMSSWKDEFLINIRYPHNTQFSVITLTINATQFVRFFSGIVLLPAQHWC